MFFNPVQIDTFALQLRFLEVTDRNHLRLNFNNPLDLHSVDPRNFRIIQLPGREELSDGIKTYYYSPFSDNVLSLYSDNLVPGAQYQLSVDRIDDVYGNSLTGLLDSTTLFTASTLQDTLPFSLTFLDPADSTFNVPVHTPIMMSFNQPLDSSVLASHFFVHDSLDRPVPGSITSKSTSEYHFLPENNYQPGMKYEISLDPDSILSVEGKQLNLEKSSFSFGTIEEQNTGAVLGTIDVIGDPERYAIIVRLHGEGRSGDLPVISRDRSGGTFEFRGILPGEYILDAFLDKDGSGTWSPGAIRPFKPAEPFAVYSRLVTVRPGIENTGINLVLYIRKKGSG